MKRRSFLGSVAALAASPLLPAAAALRPAQQVCIDLGIASTDFSVLQLISGNGVLLAQLPMPGIEDIVRADLDRHFAEITDRAILGREWNDAKYVIQTCPRGATK